MAEKTINDLITDIESSKADIQSTIAAKGVTVPEGTSLANTASYIAAIPNTTYTLSKSGSTITLTGSDGSTSSVTDTDTNTNTDRSSLAYSSTAAATAAKVASMTGFALSSGQYILLKMETTNSATSNVTLNVNSTGAKPVKIGNSSTAPTASNFPAGEYIAKYDGTNWILTRIYWTDNNTTYNAATTSAAGLMSAADKTKLDGIANNANNYSHPRPSSSGAMNASENLYKFTTDGYGHISSVSAVTKSDITGLGIPAQDTTYSAATTSAAGLMSAADKTKLDGIATGANKYSHPAGNAASKSSGLYKFATDSTSHITSVTAVVKSDITALGIPAQDTTYSVATTSTAGLVKSTTTGTTADRNYNVEVNSDGTMKVNVPWVNSTYTFNGAVSTIKDSNLTTNRALVSNGSGKVAVSAVTSTELGYLSGVTSSVQTQLNEKVILSDAFNGTGEIVVADEQGSVKGSGYSISDLAEADHTHATSIAESSGTSQISLAHGKKYALNAGGTSYIFSMPSDNNTHYTTGLYVGATNTKTNAATSNGGTYLKLYDDSTKRSEFLIKGSGATSVTSDASGNITISSTNSVYDDAGVKSRLTTLEAKPGLDKTGTITSVKVNGTSVATSGEANITSIPWSIVTGHNDVVELTGYSDANAGRGIVIKGGNSGYGTGGTNIRHTSTSSTFNTLKLPTTDGTFATEEWVTGKGYTTNTGTVTSVRVQATSPVVSSSNTAQTSTLNTTISLADAYGDTKNPYGSKNANYVLAAPNGSAGAPSFRALAAADIPSLAASKITSGTFGTDRIPSLASSKITAMTSYSKPSATSAIAATDSLNTAIGKLEKALDGKAASDHSHDVSIAASSGTNELTLTHGTKYALTAGGQSFIFTMPSDNNTDTKVTQAYSTASNSYPLLMTATAGNTSTSSRGATTAILSNSIYANPSTGGLVATTLYEGTTSLADKYAPKTHTHDYATKASAVTLINSADSSSLDTAGLSPMPIEFKGSGPITLGASYAAGKYTAQYGMANSGVTAGTYGPSANVTGSNNATISVPEITVDSYGRVTSVTNRTYTSVNTDSDTKNTTGTSNKTGTKLFLAGATSQATNPQTYSNSNVYIGTDNCLYSNGTKVATTTDISTVTAIANGKTKTYIVNDASVSTTFNSSADDVTASGYVGVNGSQVNPNLGDVFLVKNTNLPDRWVSAISDTSPKTYTLSKLETVKVDLDPIEDSISDLDTELTGLIGDVQELSTAVSGKSVKGHTHTVSAPTITVTGQSYTPAGSVTVTPNTTTVNSITAVGTLPSLTTETLEAVGSATFTAGTTPVSSATFSGTAATSGANSGTGVSAVNASLADGVLTITAVTAAPNSHTHSVTATGTISLTRGTAPSLSTTPLSFSGVKTWSAGTLPTKGSNTTVVTGIKSASFSGTAATIKPTVTASTSTAQASTN